MMIHDHSTWSMSRTTGENALPLASAPALSSAPRPLRAAELPAELRAGPDLRRGTSPAPGERPRRERPRRATTGVALTNGPPELLGLGCEFWATSGGFSPKLNQTSWHGFGSRRQVRCSWFPSPKWGFGGRH